MLVLSTVCSVALPTLMTNIVDYGIGEKDLHYVFRTAGIMAGVAIADALLVVAAYWLETKALEAFGRDLRAEIFRKATSLSPDEFAKFGAGGLITRSIEDADRVGEVVSTLMSALSAIPFTMIFGTVLAFRRDPLLALILFAFVPVLIAVVLPVSRKVHPLWKTSDEYMDKQNALVRSRLSGIRVVRAFNREGAEQEKIASATRVMAGQHHPRQRARGADQSRVYVFAQFRHRPHSRRGRLPHFPALLFADGGRNPRRHRIRGYDHVGISEHFLHDFRSSPRPRQLRAHRGGALRARPVGTRGRFPPFGRHFPFGSVLPLSGKRGDALSGVTMEILPGERAAVIGGTGSGKSTLVRLLSGLALPTSGELRFDGRRREEMSGKNIRDGVSCVLQRDTIFSGTLRDNVAAGRQVSDDEVISALRDAQLYDFAAEREEGINYPVTQRGGNLSGGQKQRLAIARAIAKPAAVYIFDDSFSALDFLTESRLRARLSERLKAKTQIVVTQRVSTAMSCDKIFVFDGGRLVASGTHAQLMETCSVYREIEKSQSGIR